MKRIYMMLVTLLVTMTGFAQTDSSGKMTDTAKNTIDTSGSKADTLVVGNFIIIKKQGSKIEGGNCREKTL